MERADFFFPEDTEKRAANKQTNKKRGLGKTPTRMFGGKHPKPPASARENTSLSWAAWGTVEVQR